MKKVFSRTQNTQLDTDGDQCAAEREIQVLRRFREAGDEVLFGKREKSVILDVSESWLEKGNGPRTRRIGRLKKSTKGDILEYLQGLEE